MKEKERKTVGFGWAMCSQVSRLNRRSQSMDATDFLQLSSPSLIADLLDKAKKMTFKYRCPVHWEPLWTRDTWPRWVSVL